MSVSTVSDIIRGALQDLGRLAAGETVSANDADLGLERLNGLLDQWAADRLAIYITTRTTWTITQTASFTIGTSATINRSRPVWVDQINYQDSTLSTPIEIPLMLLTDSGYANWPMKTQTSTRPTAAYYDPTFSSGNGTVYLLPIVTASGLQGVLYAPSQIARYAAITDSFSLPPGYERFIRTNLAMELAAPFEATPQPWLVDAAKDSGRTVRNANVRMNDMGVDPAFLNYGAGSWSILTGP